LQAILFLFFYVAPLCADTLSVFILPTNDSFHEQKLKEWGKEKVKMLPPSFRQSNTRIRVLLKYGPLGSASGCWSIFREHPDPWALLYIDLRPKSGVEAKE
jgi:hypothetical protein